MYIKEVSLQGFRNLEPLHIAPTAGMNLFYGDNAQGKTNFLESLYFCALGRSLRGRSEQQLIAFGEEESHIRLEVMRKNSGKTLIILWSLQCSIPASCLCPCSHSILTRIFCSFFLI